jgi:hypothetical protein
MTTTYGIGFDFARPRSRGARIAWIDTLATLLDTALVIPGTSVRFGLDALIGLFPAVGDIITAARCRCSSCTRPTSSARRAASSHACSATLRSTACSARCRFHPRGFPGHVRGENWCF